MLAAQKEADDKNIKKAIKYFKKAANFGSSYAKTKLDELISKDDNL